MFRRLFQRFKERVKSRGAKHMNLVDNIHFVLSELRRKPYLVNKVPDVINRVVGSRIELVHVQRGAGVKRNAGLALIAGLALGSEGAAVDRLCEDARAGGFPYTAGSAKEVSLRQLPVKYGVFQGRSNMTLPHHGAKMLWPVLTR